MTKRTQSLLFLAHRLPYPPNKGDKVRSFHFLQHLARRYRVFLGTFVDDPRDWQHVDALRDICAGIHVEKLVPWTKRIRSAAGLFGGSAMTLGYFHSPRLHAWVKTVAEEENVTRAFAFSSAMAQYALDLPGVRSFVDMVDMDSAKWDEYARRRPWPISAIYRTEATRLFAYEREIAARAEASIFVTRDERKLFCDAAPESASRVVAIENGVDSVYFAPSTKHASPFPGGMRPIVFTGAMDYWPNVDAVVWFSREVLPAIRRSHPDARLYVVGMNPDATVRALASDPAITVTGRVDDVRPYLQHAAVVVAPLRVARGIQNKVLEAMAMAKAVVVTTPVAAGLSARQGVDIEVAQDAPEYAWKVQNLMEQTQRAERMGALARARVLSNYAWSASYLLLDELLQRGNAPQPRPGNGVPDTPRCTLAAT